MEAFVYCWTDHLKQKLYVGWHKGSLTDGYICSSKPMLEQYSIRPEDFTRQIISSGTCKHMINFEKVILNNVNAKASSSFYNMHNGDGLFHLASHTEETKQKIREKALGRSRPDVSLRNKTNNCMNDPIIRARMRANLPDRKGANNSRFGVIVSEETKLKISIAHLGVKMKPRTNEAKQRDKESALRREKKACSNCGNMFAINIIDRWHNTNCKVNI